MDKFYLLYILCFLVLLYGPQEVLGQHGYWQQKVDYKMEVDFDVSKHQYKGKQVLTYTNNSPDTLQKVFYHLYFNAFQPGSMMDVRSRTIVDPDKRVADRIYNLKPNEIGYQKVNSLSQNKKGLTFKEVGTILEVDLAEPILPGKTTTFEMGFEAQVPLQIRRSGRNSSEGVAYSMAQWYPKICAYDFQGWHANPYIAREFHGVWGDFEVQITIDSTFVVAGTGYLQNADKVGHGYEKPGQKVKRPNNRKLTWHFKAPNVHDFVWAADPEYNHITHEGPDGLTLRFFYKDNDETKSWKDLPKYTARTFEIMNENFGKYPYETYSVIQGGDGGMEYPMATLITGHRNLKSLVGVTVHEVNHSWFQGLLATNESLHPWMDEGFVTYASEIVMKELFPRDPMYTIFPLHFGTYNAYLNLVESGQEEPLTTHADHYNTNRAYGIASYSKGAIYLNQLRYIIGDDSFKSGMLRYFHTWKFKHPTPNDLLRIMEKESGLELAWYHEYWVNSTKTIDYSIKNVLSKGGNTLVTLERVGDMIMPIDLEVELKNGTKKVYYLPLRIMRGGSPMKTQISKRWTWNLGHGCTLSIAF